jgi:hypothetical protein
MERWEGTVAEALGHGGYASIRRMEIRVASMDEHASRLLGSGESWNLLARFERAFLISCRTDGTIVSVVRSDLPDGPYTARLDRSAPRDFRDLRLAPRLAHDGARRWRATQVTPAEAVDRSELARRVSLLGRIAGHVTGPPRGAAAVIPAGDLAELEEAIAGDDIDVAAAVSERIAGLGPGLTPSGDDVLAGALAAHAWAEAAGLVGTTRIREVICQVAAPRTSRLAGQMLRAATAGQVTAPLAALLTGIFGRRAPFPPDLAGILAVGATSGADLLAGTLLAGRGLGRHHAAPAGAPR